jgi:hypothetical protein
MVDANPVIEEVDVQGNKILEKSHLESYVSFMSPFPLRNRVCNIVFANITPVILVIRTGIEPTASCVVRTHITVGIAKFKFIHPWYGIFEEILL